MDNPGFLGDEPAVHASGPGHGLRELLGRLQLPHHHDPKKERPQQQQVSTVSAIVAKTFPPSPLHKAAALMCEPSPRPTADNRRNLRRSGEAGAAARLSKRRGPLGAAWKLSLAGGGGNGAQGQQAQGWRSALLAASVLVAAALASLVVAGAWLYLYSAPARDASIDPQRVYGAGDGVSIVLGDFRITNEEYTPELADTTSEDFRELALQISHNLDALFGQSGLSSRYNGSQVSSVRQAVPAAPGLRVSCRLSVLGAEVQPALVGVEFLRGLRHRRGRMWLGNFAIDVQDIDFNVETKPEAAAAAPPPAPTPHWSSWSEWSECPPPEAASASAAPASQSRSRVCLSASGVALTDVEPCLLLGTGGGDLEARDCAAPERPAPTAMAASVFEEPAARPPDIAVMDLSRSRRCDECVEGEVCVALLDEDLPSCHQPTDPQDPTGCGGLCKVGSELCYKLDIDAYRCMDDSSCLPSEWQCVNKLCIPQVKRCDGHMNCYDHTDEYGCDCDLGDHFQCGNETSCLPLKKHCDGVIDCWDGSDEFNCTIACPSDLQFTCTNGQCIPRSRFCDGYADCADKSDEPFGCGGECKGHEWKCGNGRCILREEVCDSRDDCGDFSDESHCDTGV